MFPEGSQAGVSEGLDMGAAADLSASGASLRGAGGGARPGKVSPLRLLLCLCFLNAMSNFHLLLLLPTVPVSQRNRSSKLWALGICVSDTESD